MKNNHLRRDSIAREIDQIPVYHVDTSSILTDRKDPDFANIEQELPNIEESLVKLQEIVEFVSDSYQGLFKPALARKREQTRTLTKHGLVRNFVPAPRHLLPDISSMFSNFFNQKQKEVKDFLPKKNSEPVYKQLPLSGMEQVAVRVISGKDRKKLRKTLKANTSVMPSL